jgi:hypothetical protein
MDNCTVYLAYNQYAIFNFDPKAQACMYLVEVLELAEESATQHSSVRFFFSVLLSLLLIRPLFPHRWSDAENHLYPFRT